MHTHAYYDTEIYLYNHKQVILTGFTYSFSFAVKIFTKYKNSYNAISNHKQNNYHITVDVLTAKINAIVLSA